VKAHKILHIRWDFPIDYSLSVVNVIKVNTKMKITELLSGCSFK
jgi:hypothetical protein